MFGLSYLLLALPGFHQPQTGSTAKNGEVKRSNSTCPQASIALLPGSHDSFACWKEKPKRLKPSASRNVSDPPKMTAQRPHKLTISNRGNGAGGNWTLVQEKAPGSAVGPVFSKLTNGQMHLLKPMLAFLRLHICDVSGSVDTQQDWDSARYQFSQCCGLEPGPFKGPSQQLGLMSGPGPDQLLRWAKGCRSALACRPFNARRLCSGRHVTLQPFPRSCRVMDVSIVDASFACPSLPVFAFLTEQVLRYAER